MQRYDFDENGKWIEHSFGDYMKVNDHVTALSASDKRVKELEVALRSYWQAEHDSVKEHLQREYGEAEPTEESIKEFTCQCHAPDGIVCDYCAARKLLEAPHEHR